MSEQQRPAVVMHLANVSMHDDYWKEACTSYAAGCDAVLAGGSASNPGSPFACFEAQLSPAKSLAAAAPLCRWLKPAGQSKHIVSAGFSLYLPLLQYSQRGTPSLAFFCPGKQGMQAEDPLEGMAYPRGQSSQECDAARVLKRPALQALHCTAPDSLASIPGKQAAHMDLLDLVAAKPLGHCSQGVNSPGFSLKVPGGQPLQSIARPNVLLYLPLLQFQHLLS